MTLKKTETDLEAMARIALTPECLSAAVLVDSQIVAQAAISETVAELKRQTAVINHGDMTRMENMLIAQSHTLNGLFAKLTSKAMHAENLNIFEAYMRLAFKAQNQTRATLQTLFDLKAPRHIAFVQQANIGNQVQVNNKIIKSGVRARKNQTPPNKLLETTHEQHLDTGTTSATSKANSTIETMG